MQGMRRLLYLDFSNFSKVFSIYTLYHDASPSKHHVGETQLKVYKITITCSKHLAQTQAYTVASYVEIQSIYKRNGTNRISLHGLSKSLVFGVDPKQVIPQDDRFFQHATWFFHRRTGHKVKLYIMWKHDEMAGFCIFQRFESLNKSKLKAFLKISSFWKWGCIILESEMRIDNLMGHAGASRCCCQVVSQWNKDS